MPQSPVDLEDKRILAMAKQLCQVVGLGTFYPDRVLWCDFLHDVHIERKVRVRWLGGRYFGHMLSAHYPILVERALVLREMMHGRLQPDEWEPLICSSLILFRQLRWKRNLERFVALLPLFAALGFADVAEAVYRFLGYPLPPWQAYTVLLAVVLVSPIFPGAYLIRRFDRRLSLEADRKTALVLGKERMLHVLEKIDAMRQSDYVQGRQNEWREFMFVPTPAQRIANLQTSLDK